MADRLEDVRLVVVGRREGDGEIRQSSLVDSCVLLDLATEDPKWAEWADDAVTRARDEGEVVINPLVYAEVSVGFSSIEDLEWPCPGGERRHACRLCSGEGWRGCGLCTGATLRATREAVVCIPDMAQIEGFA